MVAAGSGKPGTPPAQYTEAREGSATVQTGLIDRGITELNKLIEEAGFDPESWMLKPGTGIRKSDWDALRRDGGETIVQPMQSVRMELVQRTTPVNVDELVRLVGKQVPAPAISTSTTGTFVCMWSDSQCGKAESPLDQVIPNFKGMVLQSVNEFKRSGLPDVHIPMLGDACEGIVSQGGKNMWRTTLTITEQVRVLRRLYLWIIDQFVDAGAHRITAVTVASNHGQAQRQPVETRADDDWGIDALVAVDDAIKLNPERYGHVEIYVPGDDEANVVLEIAGVVIAHTHGHHFYKGGNAKKSAFDWWRGNTFSGTDIGQATLLLSGHGHHMEIAEESGKTWIMAPAVESESNWWRLRTGQTGDPGMITFEIVDGVVQRLTRLRPREIGTMND